MYEGEQTQQEAKIAKMKEEGVDEYDVRKQEEVLAETVMMIPERRTALESASQDLTDLLVRRARPRTRPSGSPAHPPRRLTAFASVVRRKRRRQWRSASARRLRLRRTSSLVLASCLAREWRLLHFNKVSFVTTQARTTAQSARTQRTQQVGEEGLVLQAEGLLNYAPQLLDGGRRDNLVAKPPRIPVKRDIAVAQRGPTAVLAQHVLDVVLHHLEPLRRWIELRQLQVLAHSSEHGCAHAAHAAAAVAVAASHRGPSLAAASFRSRWLGRAGCKERGVGEECLPYHQAVRARGLLVDEKIASLAHVAVAQDGAGHRALDRGHGLEVGGPLPALPLRGVPSLPPVHSQQPAARLLEEASELDAVGEHRLQPYLAADRQSRRGRHRPDDRSHTRPVYSVVQKRSVETVRRRLLRAAEIQIDGVDPAIARRQGAGLGEDCRLVAAQLQDQRPVPRARPGVTCR